MIQNSDSQKHIADFLLEDHGSVLFLHPQNKSAEEWLNQYVSREGYQPQWPSVLMERRLRAGGRRRRTKRGLYCCARTGGAIVSRRRRMDSCGTCKQIGDLFRIFAEHAKTLSPKEKALLRIELRKQFKVPSRPEPDAIEN
jgi:hypothetical protein